MNAIILSIGSELTSGQTVDTNAAWVARQLASRGIHCLCHVTVDDELAPIREAIVAATKQADLVLITGGLGPTPDDLTRQAIADAMGCELVFHEPSYQQIEAYFATRKREVHPANRVQAMIPADARPIENTCGTAPGVVARLHNADVFSMPGVPSEMRAMFTRDVLPTLKGAGTATIAEGELKTFGMSESELGERIADLMQRGRNPSVGTSASDLVITVRVNAHGETADAAQALMAADVAEIRKRLGEVVFGEGEDTLADAVARLLTERKQTIATAESCTGGLLAGALTDVPGSSAYYLRGWVTYSNDAKVQELGVPTELIAQHGAVSSDVAEAMAVGARAAARSDVALSTTGIAGPTGGTAEKPIGLVFVALATAEGVESRELRLGETLTREQVRDRSVKACLNLLRRRLNSM